MKFKVLVIDFEIPPRVKRWALRTGIPATVVAGAGAIAYAGVPIVFTSHGPLTAGDLNADFYNLDSRLGTLEDGGAPYSAQAGHALTADNATRASGGAPGTFAVQGDLTTAGNASVAGTLSVGLHVSTNCTFDTAQGFTDCTCASNEVAIGGGAYGGGPYLDESRNPAAPPAVGGSWRVGCRNSSGARTQCFYPTAICARLAP
jgi:hypothetical protein